MDKQTVEHFIGKRVRIRIGERLFSPPPGYIDEVSENYYTFRTIEKTAVLSLSELKEIVPVNHD